MKTIKKLLLFCILGLSVSAKAQLTLPVKHSGGSHTFQEINASVVNADFKKQFSGDAHPRLLYTNQTIDRIKKLVAKQDPFVRMYLANAKKAADAVLKEPLLNYGLDAANLRIPSIHQFAGQVPGLIFMYQITGDKKYAERCYRQFEVLAAYPDWGADRHFLDTGIGAFIFAFVYDGLYHYLSPKQRRVLEEAVYTHALRPGKYQIENGKGVWKWYVANNNWNGICNGGLIAASLALYDRDPKFASGLIASAASGLPRYLIEFEPDGQSEEGLMYWSYGLMYTVLALESMNNTLGTTYGLADLPGLKKSGWFPFLLSGPVVSLNIGDDPLRKGRDASFFWFSRFYKDSALARQHFNLCLEKKSCHWGDIYFYDPDFIGGEENREIALDNYIRGIELYSLRENWTSKDAMYIAMHGGANHANHGHLDAGSFYIQAMGEVFAYGNLGSDNYTYPGYFSKKTCPDYSDPIDSQKESGRWHFYRLRTEGKNCLVVNPSIRPEQKETGTATLYAKETSQDGTRSSYTIDLSDCYERDVKAYHRTIGLDRQKKELSVTDQITCKDPHSTIWWFMHTKADVELQDDGRIALLTVNGKRLKAEITSPSEARFTVLPATYLYEDAYPLTKNSENAGFKKLAIELKGTAETTLCTIFYKY